MFSIERDIEILHGGFLSVQQMIIRAKHKDTSRRCTDLCGLSGSQLDEAASIIGKTIDFIACGYGRSVAGWSSAQREYVLQRIHAALLYKVLRSCSISCDSADQYYESLLEYLMYFDWNLYTKLVSKSCLIGFFVQCVVALPDDVTRLLLRWIVADAKSGNEIPPVMLYYASSILIYKSFKLPSLLDKSVSRFDFDFEHSGKECDSHDTQAVGTEIDPSSDYKHLFDELLHAIQQNWGDGDHTIILLDWFCAFMDRIVVPDVECREIINSELMESYFVYMKTCLSSERVINRLKCEIEFVSHDQLTQSVSHSGFTESSMYILFLLHFRWQRLSARVEPTGGIVGEIVEVFDSLYAIHPLQTRNQAALDHCVEVFLSMITHQVDGMQYAIQVFLEDIELRRMEKVIDCIRNNLTLCIRDILHMKRLLGIALEESGQVKTLYIELFFRAFKQLVLDDQCALLKYFLTKWGLVQDLKLASFKDDYTALLNLTVTAEQGAQLIILLCMQSVEEIFPIVVEWIVNHGIQSQLVIEALKSIDFVCGYRVDADSPPLLLKYMIQYVLDRNLDAAIRQHILQVVALLMKALSSDTFPLDCFFKLCIQPYLHVQNSSEDLTFATILLNEALKHSVNTNCGTWLMNINISALIVCLSSLIDLCIISFNGRLKEKVIESLDHLWKLQEKDEAVKLYYDSDLDKEWVRHRLTAMHPVVSFYAMNFIELLDADVQCLDLPSLLSLHVIRHNKDAMSVHQELTAHSQYHGRISLVISLAQGITHFTDDESLRLVHLLDCFIPQTSLLDSSLLSSNAEAPEILKNKLRAIYLSQVFIDAIILLKMCKDMSFHWLPILTSFSKVIKTCLCMVSVCPVTMSKVFLEVCRLSELFEDDFNMLEAMLTDILNELRNSLVDASVLEKCDMYILAAIQHCGTFDATCNFLGVLSKRDVAHAVL